VEKVVNTQDIQIYSVKYRKHFTKAVLYIIFTHKEIHLQSNWNVYFRKVALNFTFSCLKIFILLKIFVPAENARFLKQGSLSFEL
jgi:succinate dehydrogenase hydrophobic anchor subunit